MHMHMNPDIHANTGTGSQQYIQSEKHTYICKHKHTHIYIHHNIHGGGGVQSYIQTETQHMHPVKYT